MKEKSSQRIPEYSVFTLEKKTATLFEDNTDCQANIYKYIKKLNYFYYIMLFYYSN